MTSLTVVVPVYNEGDNIVRWWASASLHLPAGARVLVVYDHEQDTTIAPARHLQATGAPVELVRNRGTGVLEALKTGLSAVESGCVLVSMADGSDDFTSLPAMLSAWEAGAAVVVASRFCGGGGMVGGPRLKGALARIGARVLSVVDYPTLDASNNFRLYDAVFLRSVAIESVGGFEIAFELTNKAWMSGRLVVEVPTVWREREVGESRFNLRKWLPLYWKLWLQALTYGANRSLGTTPRGDVPPRTFISISFLTIAATVVMLALFRPDAFHTPQLWAEDAAVFLREAREEGLAAVTMPYAGYYHLFPRIVALASGPIPIAWIPTFFLGGALLGHALAVVMVLRARIGRPLPTKVLLALTLVTPPISNEVLLTITNTQWVVAPALLLLVLSRPPSRRSQALIDVVLLILFGMTGPFVALYSGFLLVRAIMVPGLYTFTMFTVGIGCTSFQIANLSSRPSEVGMAPISAFVDTIGARILNVFFGWDAMICLANPAIARVAAAVIFLCAMMIVREAWRSKDALMAGILAGGGLVLAAGLAAWKHSPLTLAHYEAGDRYFHVPIVAMTWALILVWPRLKAIPFLLLAAMATVLLTGIPRPPRHDFRWEEYSRCIEKSAPCRVPVNPPGWFYDHSPP